jgi:hypothetical protein
MTWHVVGVLLGEVALLLAVAAVFALAWLLPRPGRIEMWYQPE